MMRVYCACSELQTSTVGSICLFFFALLILRQGTAKLPILSQLHMDIPSGPLFNPPYLGRERTRPAKGHSSAARAKRQELMTEIGVAGTTLPSQRPKFRGFYMKFSVPNLRELKDLRPSLHR
jgi:hypothetical protein